MDNPENVLEVGAGTQELKKHLDCDYVSCDFEVGFRPDVVGDAHCLPFRNNAFDTIVTKNVLQHVPDWREALREILRVGENVLMAERVWDKETKIVYREPVLRRRFNPQDLLDEIGDAEFKISKADDRLGLFHKRNTPIKEKNIRKE